jgi:hypothetical protein
MIEDGIYIRITTYGTAFTYSVLRGGRLVDTGTVEAEDEVAPGYYGGSESMD